MISDMGTIVCSLCGVDGTWSNRDKWDAPENVNENNYSQSIVPAMEPYMPNDGDDTDRVLVRQVARSRAKEYGWVYKNRKDICPKCIANKSLHLTAISK